MELKKTFNPSTWLGAGEMSVLFPILTLYTLAYLALMGYDFAAKSSFEMPPGMMGIYIALTLAYATDKEIRRWIGKEAPPQKKGAFFVYAWLVFYLVVFIIGSLKPDYPLPADLNKVALQVLGIFFGSKISKKIFDLKKGPVGTVVSILKSGEEKTPGEKPIAVEKKPVEAAENPEEVILDLIRKNDRAKREDLLPVTGMSRSSLGRLLDEMEAKGKITQVGKLKWSYYVLAGSKGS